MANYSKDKLTKVSDPSGGETKEDSVLEYDIMQRIKRSEKKIGGETATFEKTFDSAGRVLTITYPGNKTYSYEYDVAGNLLYLKDNISGTKLAEYSNFTALGQPQMKTFPIPGGVVQTTYEYYPATGRLKKLETDGLTAPPGNLNNITHTYGYDSLNRLDWAKGNNGSAYNHDYNYDRIGNITYKSDVGSYSYNYSNKPHAVNSAGGITLQYDANGNMTSRVDGSKNLGITYNYDNKPTLITNYGSNYLQFTYDGNAQRVKKYNYQTGYTVLYFGSAYEKRGGVGIIHLFAGNQRIASVRPDGTTQFYHPDHLGSSWIVTDGSGAIKEKNEFHPFGTYHEAIEFDPSFPDINYTFTGQEEDDEIGLYNYNARLYDPVLGRFISPDRLVPDPGDPQGLNRYSYCLNNPLIYVDPSGNFAIIDDIIAAIVYLATSKLFISVSGGAALGAMQSAATGGNVWQGALTGAIGGALFFGAGEVVGELGLAGATTIAGRAAVAGIHAAAGMVSGGINSAITGGNIGLGMLTGGISGGIGSFAGGFLPKDFGSQLIGRSLIGGIAGGITAEIAGGDFGQGFALGAGTAAAGFLFNCVQHPLGLYRIGPNGELIPVAENIPPGTINCDQYPSDPLVDAYEAVGPRIAGGVFRTIDQTLDPPWARELAKVPPSDSPTRSLPPPGQLLIRGFMLVRGLWVNVMRPQIPPELLERPGQHR